MNAEAARLYARRAVAGRRTDKTPMERMHEACFEMIESLSRAGCHCGTFTPAFNPTDEEAEPLVLALLDAGFTVQPTRDDMGRWSCGIDWSLASPEAA